MDRIDLKKLDPDFKHRVARELGGEHIKRCFSCGVCSARCPIEKIEPEYNPRKIIRMILLGLEKELLKEEFLWHCSTCYTCQESCPQQVNFTEVIFALRNMAVPARVWLRRVWGQPGICLNSKGDCMRWEISRMRNVKEWGLPTIKGNPEDYKKLLGL